LSDILYTILPTNRQGRCIVDGFVHVDDRSRRFANCAAYLLYILVTLRVIIVLSFQTLIVHPLDGLLVLLGAGFALARHRRFPSKQMLDNIYRNGN